MKVYILTKGEYSNYHIVAVFSTKEKAEECKILFTDEYTDRIEIEEYEIDKIPECPEGLLPFDVKMYIDTGEAEAHRKSLDCLEEKYELREDTKRKKYIYWSGFAKDEQHAIKIVSEKRSQQVVNKEWFREIKR